MGVRIAWAVGLLVVGCTGAFEQASTTTVGPPQPSSTSTSTSAPATTTSGSEMTTYLVWTSGGLTDGLVSGLEGRFDDLSIVTGDAAELDVGARQVVPMDAIGIDAAAHAVFDPAGEITDLRPGTVILGESSAAFRGLEVGDSVTFDGVTFPIVAVVSDDVVGWSEVVFDKTDDRAPVATNRYVLIRTDMERSALEGIVADFNDGPVPARIKAEGESPWLRHADGTLPQVLIKEALGEFS